MTNAILMGQQHAGNPHVRFDEGEVASEKPVRVSQLYKKLMLAVAAVAAVMGTKAEALPEGYDELDSIISSGTQYIDTGVTPLCTDRFEAHVRFLAVTGNQGVWCSRSTSSSKSTTCFAIDSKLRFDRNSDTTAGHSEPILALNADYSIAADYGTCLATVNGERVTLLSEGTFTSGHSVYLFASMDGTTGQANNFAKLRFYSFKVFAAGGALKHDFVPCRRRSDGALGLYDRADETIGFCGNAGSGTFQGIDRCLPKGYAKLEYVEASGSQWVDTGFVPHATDRIEVRFSMLDSTAENEGIFCSRGKDNTDKSISLLFNNQAWNVKKNRLQNVHGGTGSWVDFPQSLARERVYDAVVDGGDLVCELDGIPVSKFEDMSFNPTVRLALFATITTTVGGPIDPATHTIGSLAQMRLYGFKVDNPRLNGPLVDLVPCKRMADEKVGLYDLVRCTFLTNGATGVDLKGGPAVNEWIREPGVSKTEWNRRCDAPGTLDFGEARGGTVTCNMTDAQLAQLPCGRHDVVFTAAKDDLVVSKTVTVTVRDPLVCTPDASLARADFTFAAAETARDLFIAYGPADGGDATNGWAFVEKVATVSAGVDHLDGVSLPTGLAGQLAFRAFLREATSLLTAHDYVTDGLVALYDAKENAGWGRHEPSRSSWADLVGGGHPIPLASGDTIASDYIEIGKTEHTADSALFSTHVNATLECNVKPIEQQSGGGSAFVIVPDVGSLIWVADDIVLSTRRPASLKGQYHYQSYETGYETFADLVASGDYLTIAACYSYGDLASVIPVYVNGSLQEASGKVNHLNYNSAESYVLKIGSAQSKSRFRSVRVYNRNLTPDEARWNRRVDESRYEGRLEPSPALYVPRATAVVKVHRIGGAPQSAQVEFGGSSDKRTLYLVWGKDDAGDSIDAWQNVQAVGQVDAGAVSAAFDFPEELRTSGTRGKFRVFVADDGGLTARDYVRDGLVLQYDAIENAGFAQHAAAPTVWKDLAGSHDLPIKGVDAVLPTSVVVGKAERNPSGTVFSSRVDATFECSVAPLEQTNVDGNPFMISPYVGSLIWVPGEKIINTRRPQGTNTGTSLFLYQNYTTGYASFEDLVASGDYLSISAGFGLGPGTNSIMPFYVNGERQWLSGLANRLNNKIQTTLTLTIGHANNRSRFRSIRIYNRHLSPEEVRQNSGVDARRFDCAFSASDACSLSPRGLIIVVE